ncbi:hypothetical protein CGH28_11830 [Vibrio parahaemolyticus]|nr:hypothetical protein CGJ99_03985 [Vibrio parahaemolyticus]TOO79747.1 hypothetical protein CGH28_11830 [Vibrio parahaemolyticus]
MEALRYSFRAQPRNATTLAYDEGEFSTLTRGRENDMSTTCKWSFKVIRPHCPFRDHNLVKSIEVNNEQNPSLYSCRLN